MNREPKTVRHYVRSAQGLGVCRNQPLPEPGQLIGQLNELVPSTERVKPASEQFEPYKDDILSLIGDEGLGNLAVALPFSFKLNELS